MKHTKMLIFLIAACCAGRVSGQVNDTLVVDSIGKVVANATTEATVSFFYPVSGPEKLVKSVRSLINDKLSELSCNSENGKIISFQGDLSNGHDVATYYANNNFRLLQSDTEGIDANGPTFSYDIYSEKGWESDSTLTMLFSSYYYMGGAHGLFSEIGVTLSKRNATPILSVIDRSKTEQIQPIITEGLTRYFASNGALTDNSDIKSLLFIGDDGLIPLPVNEPYFTSEGLRFIYQNYEIGPYAIGMPSFTVPYDKIKDFLSVEAQAMLP